MRKLLLYIIVVILAFSGFSQARDIWRGGEGSIMNTYDKVKGGLFNWYTDATEATEVAKEKLNLKIKEAEDRVNQLKEEYDTTTSTVVEKKQQFDTALKEMNEAKKALDELLGKGEEATTEDTPMQD
ncbi:MAG: hypothetical protein Q8O95_02765 [bacterium]|nr:hypothetical protein [bacterium]